ncbi:inositol-trisphosphate 3-kinase B-like [Centruroides sculpturatus]|uniref:inositol-trisphosphate 3-kinase B-like n=1 Tax=Centruroides sculpturatus TaxID=218467 RepID=UPI000C6E8225|nr:inositol-trisphosphate 3-kinase B-like [Centruroides sculpturatus]
MRKFEDIKMSSLRTRSWSVTSPQRSRNIRMSVRSPSLEVLPTNHSITDNLSQNEITDSKEKVNGGLEISLRKHLTNKRWLLGESTIETNSDFVFRKNVDLKIKNESNMLPHLSTSVISKSKSFCFQRNSSYIEQELDSSPDSLLECISPNYYLNGGSDSNENSNSAYNIINYNQNCGNSFVWDHKMRTERSNSTDSAIMISTEEKKPLFMERQKSHCEGITNSNANLINDSVQRKKSFINQSLSCPSLVMPSVIISDHSNNERPESMNDCSDLPCPDLLSVTIDDIARNAPRFRRFSTCSTGSNTSTLSTLSLEDSQSDISDSSLSNGNYGRRSSAWRKVRNIVHWSPFIQTYRKQKYPWVQLAGHQGKKKLYIYIKTFQLFLKNIYSLILNSVYLELQDLLAGYQNPCVMDVKVGIRTYLEDELAKAKEKSKLRKDMYEKMIHVDPNEPTEEEHLQKAVTKPRYMIWRETISSTATLGFRIEGIKVSEGVSRRDFKTTKSSEQVLKELRKFVEGFSNIIDQYLQRLRCLRATLEISEFFAHHEMIGSSLLFVHDSNHASIWMIDFGKTMPLPGNIKITHKDPWVVGNHEDGYLIGIDSLVKLFEELSENGAPTSTEF